MEGLSSKDIYIFKKQLEKLRRYRGKGTELISLYIPPGRKISDVIQHMRNEQGSASNIKSKSTRKNVISALEVIIQRLKMISGIPETGLVLFCGSVPTKSGTSEKIETILLTPPEPITTYKYHCNSQFYLAPLEEMLVEKETYGLLIVERKEATIGVLTGKRIEMLKHLTSGVPGKTSAGGQSQRRFERLRDIAAHEFYVRIGERANEIFLSYPNLRGLIIGGPGPTKEKFAEGNYLHHELKKKIIGVVDSSYTGEFGLREIVERSKDMLQNLDIMKEKNIVQRFLREIVKGDGLATYGENEVVQALINGSVDTLLLSEGLNKYKMWIKCSLCGYTEERTVENPEGTEAKITGTSCPKCGDGKLEVVQTKDLVEELSNMAEQIGAKTEILSTDTDEGKQFKVAFGGIGAILRFSS